MTYGKFSTISKNGFASLVKKCINAEFATIHDELIDLRNKFVAHREENEIKNALLLVGENRSNGTVGLNITFLL
ncbi:hypothetical protein ACN9MN_08065 [Chryseobacterium sp. S-02]|uniref:hypothetical protein n=1 Tax=Chryseobacterium sp. S-02 TaxID=3404064 RepID=UPI003CE7CA52